MNDCIEYCDRGQLFALALKLTNGNQPLAEEAIQHVLVQQWRGLFDAQRGYSFRAWAYRVMRHYIADIRQSWRRVRPITPEDHSDPVYPPVASDLGWLEVKLDFKSRFGHEDLTSVRAWSPRQRFVVLGWYGLWDKLPPEDQTQTLAAVAPLEPFPVAHFLSWSDRERTVYLARALRVKANTITQIRVRSREALLNLKFVQDLRS
ncbi:MAG: sigma factor [Gemmataceae bacterium]|nr:hypothetical protein [Gemmata sp.]MDW8199326.1 sigma factor [Gemmataceae bacterium]